jgi:hypothetical protein
VRKRLGLAVWQADLAVEIGLLVRHEDGSYDEAAVDAAEQDLDGWKKRLDVEQRLNATDSAKRLGVSKGRFARAVGAGAISHIAEEPWKYGIVRYYRAGDVDALAGWLVADAAERILKTSAGRPAAAEKAAATRKRNNEREAAARAALSATDPGDDRNVIEDAVHVVVWATGVLLALRDDAGALRRFAEDRRAQQIARQVRQARFTKEEDAVLVGRARSVGAAAVKRLRDGQYIRDRLDVSSVEVVANVLPMVAGEADQVHVDALAANPPAWLVHVQDQDRMDRAERRTSELLAAIESAAADERNSLFDQMGRAVSGRISLADAAQILGLPLDVMQGLHEKPLAASYLDQLRSNPPAWMASVEAARDEANRRLLSRSRRDANRGARRDNRRVRQTGRVLPDQGSGDPTGSAPSTGKRQRRRVDPG